MCCGRRGRPGGQLLLAGVDLQAPRRDVEYHVVAGADQPQWSPGGSLGRNVKDRRFRTRFRSSARRRCGPCRERPAPAASWAAACSPPPASLDTPWARSRGARAPSSRRPPAPDRRYERDSPRSSQRPGSAAMAQQMLGCRGRLDHGPRRRQAAVQDGDPGVRLHRIRTRPDHVRVPDLRGVEVLD
jgi:hypothetical protein